MSQLVSLLSRSVRTCLGVADGGVYDEDSASDGIRIPQMEGASGPLFMEDTISQSVSCSFTAEKCVFKLHEDVPRMLTWGSFCVSGVERGGATRELPRWRWWV